MSHTVDIATQIKDKDALIRALTRVDNLTGQPFSESVIEIHEQPQSMYTYDNRDVSAHIIVRLKHIGSPAYNDLGFKRKADGTYEAIISDRYDNSWLQRLSAYYGVELSKKELKQKGLKYKETVDEQGRMQLKVSVNGGMYA